MRIFAPFSPAWVIRDLCSLSTWGTWFLVVASILIGWISFSWGSASWEVLSAVSGVICVVLVAERKYSNYMWGLINCSLYGLTSYLNGFYGDMSLNWLVYVPFQFIGLWMWQRSAALDDGVETRALPPGQVWLVAACTALLIAALSFGLHSVGGNHPAVDASNVVFSLLATALMALRYREQWICWIIVNATGITMWALNAFAGSGEGIAALLMWVAFMVNSIYGFVAWSRAASKLQTVKSL